MNQQINLFHPMFRKEHKLLSFDVLWQTTLIVILALGSVYGYGVWSGVRLQKAASGLQQLKAEKLLILERLQQESLSRPVALRPADVVQDLRNELAAKKRLIEAVSAMDYSHRHGFSQYLEAFSKKVRPGMWLTGFSVNGDGNGLELRGGAQDPRMIPEFVQSLGDIPVLAHMQFRLLQIDRERDGGRWVEFVMNTNVEISRGME